MEITRSAVEGVIGRLDSAALAAERWFGGKGREIATLGLEEAFVLPGAAGHVLAIARVAYARGSPDFYLIPLIAEGGSLRVAVDGEGTLRALTVAIAEGRAIPSLPVSTGAAASAGEPTEVSAALVCRPSAALREPARAAQTIEGFDERPLGADQSNSSVVLGDRLLLKAYRWLQPGLNPDLELVAYLSEEAGFPAVPSLAGYAEVVSRSFGAATVAMLQDFVADGVDAYEWLAETLTGWLVAPGSVTVEFATEIAADLGTLTAGMHAALATARGIPGFEPRPAGRDELRQWYVDARAQLDRAIDVTPGEPGRVLRDLAPRIAEELTLFEALASEPLVTRVHGDYHLGQIVAAPDGFRIVDFEGEPTRSLDERRAHRSPLRDVASMLRSFDHVARSAGRRAEERRGGAPATPGLDLEAWMRRARERFLEAYAAGLREAGAPIVIDPDLLRALEIEKECYEFVYAATYLPEWLWAPTDGMRALIEGSGGPP